jgi:hypothetical protein
MKLENKTEKVVEIPHFLNRMFRYALFSFLLIVFSVGIGVLGYHFIGGLNRVHSNVFDG